MGSHEFMMEGGGKERKRGEGEGGDVHDVSTGTETNIHKHTEQLSTVHRSSNKRPSL